MSTFSKRDSFVSCGMIFIPTGPFLSRELKNIGSSVKIYGRDYDECMQTMADLCDGAGLPFANFSKRYGFALPNGDVVIDKKRAYQMMLGDGISNKRKELSEKDMVLSYGKQAKIVLGVVQVLISNENGDKYVDIPCTRHGQAGKILFDLGYPPMGTVRDNLKWVKTFDGFLTQNETLSRKEAAELARVNGQIPKERVMYGGEYGEMIFTEDLW